MVAKEHSKTGFSSIVKAMILLGGIQTKESDGDPFFNRNLMPDIQDILWRTNLQATDRLVFLSLAKRMNDLTLSSRQSHLSIANYSGLKVRAVLRSLLKLEEEGYIVLKRTLGQRNVYEISDEFRVLLAEHIKNRGQKFDYLESADLSLQKTQTTKTPKRSAGEILKGLRK